MIQCLCHACITKRDEKMRASRVVYQCQEFLTMTLKNGIYAQIILRVPVGKHIEFTSEILQPLRETLDITVDHFRAVEEAKEFGL